MNPNRHPVLRLFSRCGDFARGTIFVLIGALAAEAAFSLRGSATGAIGALRDILMRPHGRSAVLLVSAGLIADAVFRFAQAGFLRSQSFLRRLAYAVRGGAALIFGIAVGRVALARSAWREGRLFRTWLTRVLARKWGQDAVLAAGLVLLVAGGRECLVSLAGKGSSRRAFRRLWRIGLAAHGLLLAFIGIFTIRAAIDLDPAELVETGGALRALARLPYGAAWLFAVSGGLVAYGISLWSRPRS